MTERPSVHRTPRSHSVRRIFARTSRHLLLAILAAFALATPAGADDISATARGVVRVVTIAMVDNEVVGFGHGSGFAVAPNRIVTNAHVVELAARYPRNVVVGIVPSEGDKSYQGKVIAIDAVHDLALIEITGASVPPVALYSGPLDEGGPVTALGYPGNVDLATARSAADYIHPLTPIRSEGVFSGRRAMSGTQVLLHTAGIARGNSGGPLLDPCGRVIGVNSAITRGEDGDSSFGFAIADSELTAFLAAAKQPYTAVGLPCTSIAERIKQDSDADAQTSAKAAAAKQDAAARAAAAREIALAKARAEIEKNRDDVMALATLMLVLGSLAVSGGGFLELRDERRWAIVAAGAGVLLMGGAVAVYLNRPLQEPVLPPAIVTSAPQPIAPAAALGKLVCTIVPERSRIVSSTTGDVTLDWGAGGCASGHDQFAESGPEWERVLIPENEQTVSVTRFDPATKTYTALRYFLGAAQMDTLRKGAQQKPAACTANPAQLTALAARQSTIRATLPPYPNEKLVYACTAASK
ncbi:S1C family serine protease [Sphingomonas immobilis]|uniref:Serine protease n=1 Tax=Sphingomonas immobilis TaxID=3063997 RepID=A0ABT8ZV38_9SPHN|nr:serine protease [Sphingomonas sp. CA1-15]MDO7840860.1 serine protease [Sphingomonas sp. CA1-15]